MFNCIPESPAVIKRPQPPMPPVFYYAANDVSPDFVREQVRKLPGGGGFHN